MDTAQLLLRLGPAITMVAFGISQYFKPAGWLDFIPPWFSRMSPMKPETTMRLHAVANIVLGVWLASGWLPYASAWVALLWWISILPFAFRVSWTVGLRDLAITVGLIALIILLR